MNADGTFSPSLMVRKGDWKLIACEGDPPMLFDLKNDPDEMKNLAGKPDTAKVEAELHALINANWSPAALKKEMQESSRRRLFIQSARDASGAAAWDYEPRKDASKQYVRGGGDAAGATATKGRARYPFVPAKKPDNKLTPWVAEWALASEQARYLKLHAVTFDQLKAFYDAMLPEMEAIMAFLKTQPVEGSNPGMQPDAAEPVPPRNDFRRDCASAGPGLEEHRFSLRLPVGENGIPQRQHYFLGKGKP